MSRDREPDWLDNIRTRVARHRAEQPKPSFTSALRPAAVLVLLIDSDNGPNILLTERAAALANYPGLLVFPGGTTEPRDDGPAATALREAGEETGIDPTHVHIIGSLPPLELPATGFLVTPVVGWSTRLQLTDTFNSEEVAVAVQIPLRDIANTLDRTHAGRTTDTSHTHFRVGGTAVGDMTYAVIDSLLNQDLNTAQASTHTHRA